jgi:hypothetical protein
MTYEGVGLGTMRLPVAMVLGRTAGLATEVGERSWRAL